MKYTRHPVFRMMTPQEAVEMGRVEFERLFQEREKRIYWSKEDPLNHGWESPVWEVGDALLGINLFDEHTGPWEEKRDLNAAYRRVLGFDDPVLALLINGANRVGKTEYAAKRSMQTLLKIPDISGWAFHSSEDMSRAKDSHQPLFYKYMPKYIKDMHGENGIKTKGMYVRWSQKNGFTDNSFILDNLSSEMFKFYGQEQDKAIQGLNPYLVWLDELFPLSWFTDCMYRVAASGGWVLGTFTPKNGYSPACAWFYEGAEIVRQSVAFMLPKDGGGPDVQRALGFHTREEMELAILKNTGQAGAGGRGSDMGYGPNSVPENTRKWLTGGYSQPEIPQGRMFEMVPRVMKCKPVWFDGKWRHNRAVLFMHSSDGPYGTPYNVIQTAATQGRDEILWRVYGFTEKMKGALLKRFAKHHICKASEIQQKGTNYHIVDPGFGRNPFMLWIRFTGMDAWVYREWPGNYDIPEHGVPGEWVLPDEKRLDGKRGPGQETFGWGARDLKKEIARLEGWEDYDAESDLPDDWDEANGAKEVVFERFMDSRSLGNPKMDNDRMTTLLSTFQDLNLYFRPTPAEENDAKVEIINDWLNWSPEEDMDLSRMRLHISAECVNLIDCIRIWTGADGQKGAAKDPIDCLGYAALAQLEDVGGDGMQTRLNDFG